MDLLSKLNVRTKLIGTFLLITAGTLLGTAAGNLATWRMHRASVELYERALIPTSAIGDVMRNIHDGRAQLLLSLQHDPRGKWVALHDHPLEKHLDTYSDAFADAQAGLAAYRKRPELAEDEAKLLDEVAARLETFHQAGKAVSGAFAAGDFDAANEAILKRINPAMRALDDQVRTVEMMLIKRSQAHNAANDHLVKQVSLGMWAGAGVGLLFIWTMYFYLGRNITKPLARVRTIVGRVAQGDLTATIEARGHTEFDELLRSVARMQAGLRDILTEINHSAEMVSSHAGTLSRQIEETAGRSQQQHDRVLEVTSALEQMSRAIEEVSQGAVGVSQASVQAKDLATVGAGNMTRNLSAIDKIVATVKDSSSAIGELCESAKHISALAAIIREIADQTNLLALNAAIEAARAGEHGRGFSVVADEVRKLAERTAQSSAGIGQLLEGVTKRSDQAIAAMGQIMADVAAGAEQTRAIGATLRQILDASHEVSTLTQSIATATQQQSSASSQTARSMETISTLTEDNNATIQQVAVAASEMSSLAGRLQGLVCRFQTA